MPRPRILLTTASVFRDSGLRRMDSLTGRNYSQALAQAGGLPLLVSNQAPALADAYLASADGVVFTGGADIDPGCYGAEPHPGLGVVDAERDAFELALYRAARARHLPIFGICRGIQLINVAEGGTLHQHLPALAHTLQHQQQDPGGRPSHQLALEPGSRLAARYGAALRTNSYHHQAIDRLGAKLRAVARSTDGLIEAVEGESGAFLLGVQWHPEMSFQHHPEHHLPFQQFMEAAELGPGPFDQELSGA